MPRMKVDEIDNLEDLDELEEAEWDDSDRGSGEVPPPKIILNGYVKRMWFTYTDPDSGKQTAGSPMLVTMFVADGNVGDYEQYNGWATWDYMVIAKVTKFRWQPFCTAIGLPIKYVMANIDYDEEMEDKGWPVNWIGPKSKPKFIPGEDEDTAYLRILTKHEKDKRPRSEGGTGEYQTKIDKYLEYADPEAPEPDEEEDVEEEVVEEVPPTRNRSKSSTAKAPAARTSRSRKAAEPEPEEDEEEEEEEEFEELEDPDEQDEGDEEEEEEVPPARPARGSRRTAAAPARGTRKPAAAAKPGPGAKAAAARPAPRTRASSPAPARGKRAAKGSTEEPPF